jgi:hypothetical protein
VRRQPPHPILGWLRAAAGSVEGRLPSHEERQRMARRIRAPLERYPDQRRMLEHVRTKRRVAIHKTRRAGATVGLGKDSLAAAIEQDNWVCSVVVESQASYTRNWLARPTDESAVSLIADLGLIDLVKIRRGNEGIKAIEFPWGSQIEVLDVGSERALHRKRGRASHRWIIEEAQAVPRLDLVLKQLVTPTLADYGAHVALNGTPSPDVDGYFAQAIRDGRVDEDDDLPDWFVAELAAWRNPHFGATFEERWRRLLEFQLEAGLSDYDLTRAEYERLLGLTEQQLDAVMRDELTPELAWIDELDRDLQRELLGRWVADYGHLVFPWNRAKFWLPRPTEDLGEACRVLRETVRVPHVQLRWNAVLGYDSGYQPDPAAWTITCWAERWPVAYVIWAQIAYRLDDDVQLETCVELLEICRASGLVPFAAVGDLSTRSPSTSTRLDQMLLARLKFNLRPARKAHKDQQIKAMGLDVAAGRLQFVRGDPVDIEGRHLRWHRDRLGVVDEKRAVRFGGRMIVPGDHCLDAVRYSLPYVHALRQVTPAPPDGTAAWIQASDRRESEALARSAARSAKRTRR